jgi:hypothetical protein
MSDIRLSFLPMSQYLNVHLSIFMSVCAEFDSPVKKGGQCQ